MPDYPNIKFGDYLVRLRPNDNDRKKLNNLGFPDMINYFNSSEINFDLRVAAKNRKQNRNIIDSFKYEWVFCTEDNTQVENISDQRFNTFNTEGNGTFYLETRKPTSKNPLQSGYYGFRDSNYIMVFKSMAVKIGNYSKLGHFKVMVRLIDKEGNVGEYIRAAEFTIVDKDNLRQWVVKTVIGLFVTAIATGIVALILKACESPS